MAAASGTASTRRGSDELSVALTDLKGIAQARLRSSCRRQLLTLSPLA